MPVALLLFLNQFEFWKVRITVWKRELENHPILGESPKGKLVKFSYDGTTLEGYEGEPIAAALRVAGVMAHRYTAKRHEPRGVF